MKATRLRITSLKFISAVDAGAQGPISNVALVKRAPAGDQYELTVKVGKVDDALGVVFGYAVASTVDGGKSPHIDLQGDAVVGGDDLIKVALGFAEAGGQSDVMHDCVKDGWVPFVMPLNAETKKAFQLAGDVEGIAIGMKPSAETFKRFQSGELAAFSIFGEGVRTPLEQQQKRATSFTRFCKEAVLTSEEAGHAHTIDLDDPSRYWCDQLQTSYQTEEGAAAGHSHAWVFDAATGAITVAPDSGHTHTVSAVVPSDVLVAYSARDAQRDRENLAAAATPQMIVDSPSDGICTPVTDEESSGKVSVVVVQANAPANKSTQGGAAKQGGSRTREKTQMNIAKLLAAFLSMTPTQVSHVAKLAPDELDAFFGKSAGERETIAKAALEQDPIEVEFKGQVYRKSAGPAVIELAKAAKAQAEQLASQADAIEKADIRKQAADVLGGMPGDNDTHDYGIACLRKGGDAVKAQKFIETLKGMKATSSLGKSAAGVNPGADPTTSNAQTDLDLAVAKVAVEKGLSTEKAYAAVLDTAEGKRLYGEIQKSKNKG